MLKIKDKWIWDFWFVEESEYTHIFYLQANKSLGDERRRHHNATIGHARSKDLISWEILQDALKPGKPGSWDDLATWTGSVIKKDDIWYMYYTGVNKKEKGLIQRIGLASSKDLLSWERYTDNPIIEADPRWYEILDAKLWHDQAWRDPFVFSFEDNYYTFITARVNTGNPDERGVIALAKSVNLIEWEVLPPVSAPGDFGQLEVPQFIKNEDKNIIVFSTAIETTSQQKKNSSKLKDITTGVFYLTNNSESPLNKYYLPKNYQLLSDKFGSFYSGKIIFRDNQHYIIGFHNYNSQGDFLGYVSDPIKIKLP